MTIDELKLLTAAVLMAAFAGSACAADLTSAELERLLAGISSRCTQEQGYDPTNPGEVGEHELATGEKAWRDCFYAGVRAEIEPRSGSPQMYEEMIEQDLAFTVAIEAGKMTRFERWQQNRVNKQAAIANESLAADDAARNQKEMLDDMQRRQLETLLRVPPTQLMRIR